MNTKGGYWYRTYEGPGKLRPTWFFYPKVQCEAVKYDAARGHPNDGRQELQVILASRNQFSRAVNEG